MAISSNKASHLIWGPLTSIGKFTALSSALLGGSYVAMTKNLGMNSMNPSEVRRDVGEMISAQDPKSIEKYAQTLVDSNHKTEGLSLQRLHERVQENDNLTWLQNFGFELRGIEEKEFIDKNLISGPENFLNKESKNKPLMNYAANHAGVRKILREPVHERSKHANDIAKLLLLREGFDKFDITRLDSFKEFVTKGLIEKEEPTVFFYLSNHDCFKRILQLDDQSIIANGISKSLSREIWARAGNIRFASTG